MTTILTLTDDDALRAWLISSLTRHGASHVIAVSGVHEALDRLDLHPVDLLLVDGRTCGADPILETILAHVARRFPVLVASPDATAPAACQQLTLPCSPTQLAVAVRECLDQGPSVSRRAFAAGSTRCSLEIELNNDRRRVPPLVALLLEQAQPLGWLPESQETRVQIALEEALLNAVVHGNLEVCSRLREFEDGRFEEQIACRLREARFARRRVRIRMQGNEHEVRWTIRDEGPGFDVGRLPDPRCADRIGLASGRGVLLMRSFMDEVTYNARGNEVVLVKRNAGSDPLEQAAPACRELLSAVGAGCSD
ncbi:MAG: ATP-binding protein [Planctomyces sp.]|nr:ATP-binding protein [Planctomyces sp.]